MKVFITGATGFLGKHLIGRLVTENHEIKALTRRANALKDKSVTEVVGNLANIDEWKKELNDCDVVVHCAAKVEFWGKWEEFYKDNVHASIQLLKAAEQNNVKRFIYISSESVLQAKNDLIDIDESYPYPKEPNSFYGKSKKLAEQQIVAFNGNIQKIILRPTFIYGKGGTAIETIKQKIQSGGFSWIDKGNIKVEMVYVENVVEAIVKAFDNGKNNSVYNVTDHSCLTAKQFFTDLMALENVTIAEKSIPSFIAKPIASIVESIWKLLGLKTNPLLTRFDLSFLAMNRQYKTDKSINELGYKPIYSTEQALNEMKKQ